MKGKNHVKGKMQYYLSGIKKIYTRQNPYTYNNIQNKFL